MKFLDDMKFITEDNQEYFFAEKIVIDEELYCIAINLNNNADIMYVHADNVDGEFLFKPIEDESIISKLKDKLMQSK